MPDALGIALRLVPVARDAIRAVVGKNTVAKLIKLVEDDLRRSHLVPPGQRGTVANAWSRQRVDPELAGCFIAWLATGDEEFLDFAASRWRNLLVNDVDPTHIDIDVLVGVAMDSARGHLAQAQDTDRDAVHRGQHRDHRR